MELGGMNGDVTSADVGFRIGPRINAAGRMDAPDDALKTLMADSSETAARMAEQLDSHNRKRQKIEGEMYEDALAKLADEGFDDARDPVIVVGSDRWHPGVVGIVASRLMRHYHKPTFVISIN